jgi:uncharacterized protein
MNLKDKINSDLKDAMKSGDKTRLSTIRSIRALILEFEKSGTGKEFTEEEEIKLLSSAAKKRRESIEEFTKAGREEMAAQEKAELDIIVEYLPKQLSVSELETEIKKLANEISASGKKDFAKLMPLAAKTFKGKAEGKLIKEIVEKILGE